MYNNGNSSKNVTGASIVDGTVTNADIDASAAIAQSKLATLVITDAEVADNALSGDKIDAGIISNFQSTGIDDRLATSNAITIDASENVTLTEGLTLLNNKDLTVGGVLKGSDTTFSINTNTADGNDNARIRINGGGGNGDGRGAQLELIGNEHTFGGDATLTAGNGSGAVLNLSAPDGSGTISLKTAGFEAVKIGSDARTSFSTPNGPCAIMDRTGSTGTLQSFKSDGSGVGSIGVTGSSTSYNTSSDYRLKENVVPMTGSIDRLKNLNPSRFNFIADADKTVDGFLAHEAGEVVPEAITGTKDAMRTEEYEVSPAVIDDEDNIITEAVMGEREVEDYQGIDQSKLVPLLVAALQEAITRIETLENA
jgi:hypothetical protein